ncbi:hypothetical protein GX586_13680 [bacterium]|nr:hypothetical protein [bacterium]
MITRSALSPLAILAALCCVTASAAQYIAPLISGNFNWTNTAQWSPVGSYPNSPSDEALFTNAATITVSVNGGPVTAAVVTLAGTRITLQNGSGSGRELFLTNNAGNPRITAIGLPFNYQIVNNLITTFGQPLDVVATNTLRFYPNMVSSADVNLIANGGVIHLGDSYIVVNISTGYTGAVHVKGGNSAGQYVAYKTWALSNSAAYVVEGGRLAFMALTQPQAALPVVSNISPLILNEGATLYALNNATNGILLLKDVTVNGVVTNEYQTHTLSFTYLADVKGTGAVVNYLNGSIDTVTNLFLGSISPGFSAGTLTLDEANGVTKLGASGSPVTLNIEDGDRVALINMGAAVDLQNINVKFLTTTVPGTTNWFLHSDSGFAGGAFNTVDPGTFVCFVVSNVPGMPDYIGAVVVPEPVVLAVPFLALLLRRCRR